MCSYRGRRKGYCPGQNQGPQRGWCYRCRVTGEDWFYHVRNLQAAWNGRIDTQWYSRETLRNRFLVLVGNCEQFLGRSFSLATNKTTEAAFSYVPSVWKMAWPSSLGSPSNELISIRRFGAMDMLFSWSQCGCLISNFYCLQFQFRFTYLFACIILSAVNCPQLRKICFAWCPA